MSHWEERIFNNEVMTSNSDSENPVISRITLALFEDSGWYRPNYDMVYYAN